MTAKTYKQSGFTLIEIIVTVVMVAVFSALMITLFSDSLIKSSDPVKRLRKSSDLSRVMANITTDYIPCPKWKSLTNYAVDNKVFPVGMNGRFYICKSSGTSGVSEPLWHDYGDTYDGSAKWKAGTWKLSTSYATGDIVIPANPNGHLYRCVTAGTSGASEPGWTLTGNSAIGDGSVQWMRLLGYLNFNIGTAGAEYTNSYGKYYVLINRFVKFDASNTIQPIGGGEPENMLQVKIRNDEGETLSALFTAKEE
ncbi:MAG: prepilin-type N-terminal cleavage/methylation domain-containing protein [Pseudomonadota bacterium]